jgi:hypothetical protein
LARGLFKAPIALISFVDERREWFKSSPGLAIKETSREQGFGAQAIRAAVSMSWRLLMLARTSVFAIIRSSWANRKFASYRSTLTHARGPQH